MLVFGEVFFGQFGYPGWFKGEDTAGKKNAACASGILTWI